MTTSTSDFGTSGKSNARKIVAAITALFVAVGCVLAVTQTLLYPGEFVVTLIASAVAAAVTLRRAWLLAFSRGKAQLVLTKRPWKGLVLAAVVGAAILNISMASGSRQFLGVTAAFSMFIGYLSTVLLFDTGQQTDGGQWKSQRPA